MSDVARPGRPPVSQGTLARAARAVAAPVFSGIIGAVVFLIMVQGSFRRGHTDLDFNHVLGTVITGEAPEIGSTDQALGVIGDSVGPTGLYATLAAGIVLMILHGQVITRLVRRHWLIQAIPLGLLTFLALGLVYAPVADARLDTPIGTFGVDAGGMTPLVLLVSALGFAVIASRVHSLMARPEFWEEHHEDLERPLEEVAGIEEGSLELSEEGPEEGGVRP